MIITSSDNPKIKSLKKLTERKYREREKLFLIEGLHLINEAYNANCLKEVIAITDTKIDINVSVTYASDKVMAELSSLSTPAKVIGVCQIKDNTKITGNHIVILDSIQDPGNLGTIIRSAVAFNIDTIILGKGSVDLYNSKVLRATQGLIFHLNIMEDDGEQVIAKLKADDYHIIGTDVTGGIPLNKYEPASKYALVMGNEGHGMSANLKSLCDDFIYIPMNNKCESLNVSIACSIILYQLDMR